MYIYDIPLKLVSIRSYTPLHTTLTGFEASPKSHFLRVLYGNLTYFLKTSPNTLQVSVAAYFTFKKNLAFTLAPIILLNMMPASENPRIRNLSLDTTSALRSMILYAPGESFSDECLLFTFATHGQVNELRAHSCYLKHMPCVLYYFLIEIEPGRVWVLGQRANLNTTDGNACENLQICSARKKTRTKNVTVLKSTEI